MQHILSELERLEEVRVPRPRRELGSTISAGRDRMSAQLSAPSPPPPPPRVWQGTPHLVILRVLGVQRAAVVYWLLQEGKGTEMLGVPAPPRGQPRMFYGKEDGRKGWVWVGWPGGPGLYLRSPGRPDSVPSVLAVTPDRVMSLCPHPGARPPWLAGTSTPTGDMAVGRQRRRWLSGQRWPRGWEGSGLDTHPRLRSERGPIPAPSPPAEARLGHGLGGQ